MFQTILGITGLCIQLLQPFGDTFHSHLRLGHSRDESSPGLKPPCIDIHQTITRFGEASFITGTVVFESSTYSSSNEIRLPELTPTQKQFSVRSYAEPAISPVSALSSRTPLRKPKLRAPALSAPRHYIFRVPAEATLVVMDHCSA